MRTHRACLVACASALAFLLICPPYINGSDSEGHHFVLSEYGGYRVDVGRMAIELVGLLAVSAIIFYLTKPRET